ncbi:MAG TPA: LuxR C-terminal-related transcriptional regulator [Dongiaceae bacterium]|nr:LuxR C-terminal-related transcriptional regulator [Dongiaceae bacterium]
MEAFAPTDAAAAFYVCALASYDDVKAMLVRADRIGTAGLLLAATAWQCEGDVLRAESTLRRAADRAADDELPYVVDLLAPLLISRGMFTRAAAVVASTASPALQIGRTALQAVIDAANGAVRPAEERAAAVREALPHLDDDVLRLRIHQRLALAAYYRGVPGEALEEAAQGLRLARLLGAHRFACQLHTVMYATHYTWAGDFDAAWHHAVAIGRQAELGGDVSFGAFSRVAQYELAAERGDDAETLLMRSKLERDPLPEQYRERFAAGIADALRLAWAGEFATSRNVLTVLKDTSGRTDGERALCRALLALVAVALGDDDAARRLSRQAISNSARPEKRIVAYELRYRRLARALASVVGDMIGDVVRGRRAAEARFLQDDPSIKALLRVPSGGVLNDVPASVRGYARLLLIARDRVTARPSHGPLTAGEVDVLKMVASGKTAPQIAATLGRSPHTVRTHIRNASIKLDAHGRFEIVARARQLGLLGENLGS